MIKKVVALFLVVIIFCFCANAQTYSYKHYTIFDGLAQNQIVRLYQDQKGFIWIGTKVGISRFDGRNFINYSSKDMAIIQSFFEYNQRLFCCASNGIYLLDNDCFNNIYRSNNFDIDGVNFNADSTELWVFGNQNIVVISPKGIYNLKRPNNEKVNCVLPYKNKKGYWLSTDNGVYRVEDGNIKQKLNIINYSYSFLKYIGQNLIIYQPYNQEFNNSEKGIYIYKNNEVLKLNNVGSNVLNISFIPLDNNKLMFAQNHSTWLIMDTIGYVLDKDSIPDIFITGLLQDNNGNLWIATETGLYYRQSAAFRNYDEKSGMPKYVWSIFEDNRDRSIVFATFTGELAMLKNDVLTKIKRYKQYLKPEDLFYMNGFCNSHGEWMIPASTGTFIKQGNRLAKMNFPFDNLTSATVFSCYEDVKSKVVYFGTTSGLFSYDLIRRSVRKCGTDERLVLSLDKDKFGRLWACTGKGVLLYENNAFTQFKKNEIPINKGVISCCKDFKGNMWLAGKDALYLYSYTQKFKISEGSYFFINQYKNKYIIAGTIKGFLLIDLEKLYSKSQISPDFLIDSMDLSASNVVKMALVWIQKEMFGFRLRRVW